MAEGMTESEWVAELVERLKRRCCETRADAGRHLAGIGRGAEAAIPALAEALKDKECAVRREAAWALGRTEARAAVPPLVEALRDEDYGVRIDAARGLQRVGAAAAEALGALGSALASETDLLAREAISRAIEAVRPFNRRH